MNVGEVNNTINKSKSIAIIAKIDNSIVGESGIWDKIEMIADSFVSLKYNCTIFHIRDNYLAINNEKKKKLSTIVPRNIAFINELLITFNSIDYDIIWIRHSLFGFNVLNFLRKTILENHRIKILYEIPTFPYIYEHKGFRRILVLLHEKLVMKNLHNFVHYHLCWVDNKEINSIKTIKMTNGIKTSDYAICKINKRNEVINFIAIGLLWEWYGLERLLAGLQLAKSNNVFLHIFGIGKEIEKLRDFIKTNSLTRQVIFYGWKSKQEINDLTLENAVGIGTLSPMKKKTNHYNSLKHREFCARGIPFIYAGYDSDFDDFDCSFVYKVPLTDDPIDIKSIVHWYRHLESTPKEIREFATKNLEWRIKIENILHAIQ